MASNKKPIIGITPGDPNGIGPEIIAKALVRPAIRRLADFRLVVAEWRPRPPFLPAESGEFGDRALTDFCRGVLAQMGRTSSQRGPTKASGRIAVESVLKAIYMAMAGDIDAIVTAPISKEAVRRAGYPWPGHTEILAERSGGGHPVMTMVGGGLIVPLVTTHVSMRDLPRRITRERVLTTIRIIAESLRKYWGIQQPRIAVDRLPVLSRPSHGGPRDIEPRRIAVHPLHTLPIRAIHIGVLA